MSGHSKWNNIKRAKGAADAKKGKVFTKIGRHISMAVRSGGGADPAFNFKLRMAMEQAREVGMPKDTVERAIKKGAGEGKEAIVSVVYEGHGPAGSALIVEAITDNSNRTLQSVRNTFVKYHGRLGEQGSVAWMFEPKGQILVESQPGVDDLPLELIDAGVEDVKESEEGLEIYTRPVDLEKIKKLLETKGLKVASAELIMKPNQSVNITGEDIQKIENLIEALEEDDDVVSVHTNINYTL
jgi:YebC/PmpR family DNA-binding regulatory protein